MDGFSWNEGNKDVECTLSHNSPPYYFPTFNSVPFNSPTSKIFDDSQTDDKNHSDISEKDMLDLNLDTWIR